jgi:AcrR family transcriptional regulator
MTTARARVRAQLTREITDAAREELAVAGSSGLSLRAVARRVEMVPSALYRYFDSRDALLTALILDAYRSLADAISAADGGAGPVPLRRWVAVGHAVRDWAWSHPHEWALIYGSPVPGYEAPPDTLGPGVELFRVLAAIVTTSRHGPAVSDLPVELPVDADLAGWLRPVADPFFAGVEDEVIALAAVAYTYVLGAVSLELFGQFGPDATPAPAIFDHGLRITGALLGLPGGAGADA